MKPLLNWQTAEVVNIYDEISLWAAPFGKLLLEHIPMQRGWDVMDIGFGTGFPLIELAQRFGEQSTVTGVDIWPEAIKRCKEKIRVADIANIQIVEQDAAKLPFEDESFNLITSNLGVNNFGEKETVIEECRRVIKSGGTLAIATNTQGTFDSLFSLFQKTLKKLQLHDSLEKLNHYVEHRSTVEDTIALFTSKGFAHTKTVERKTSFRFVDAEAVFNHSLIRIGFRESWENFVEEIDRDRFFKMAIREIAQYIERHGELRLEVPVVYMEFGVEGVE